MEQHETERHAIMQQYPGFYRLVTMLGFIGIGVIAGWTLFADKASYGMNLWTDLISVGFTFLILDWWVRQRDDRRETDKLRGELIDDFGSNVNSIANHAANRLRRHGWLFDGSLEKLDFQGADLTGAELWLAKLACASLHHARLERTILRGADLENADLGNTKLGRSVLVDTNLAGSDIGMADLKEADLRRANLFDANFYSSNLEGAHLGGAFLVGADLRHANLKGAYLWDADLLNAEIDNSTQFDEQTTLPNGTKWTQDTDLGRFTDPTHLKLWRPTKWRAPGHSSNMKFRL